jgi:hypothetical protein
MTTNCLNLFSLSQNLNSTIQNFSTSLKKRRNEVLLNVETHDKNGKYLFGLIFYLFFFFNIYVNIYFYLNI